MSDLTFNELRQANLQRCPEVFYPLDHWNLQEWGNATAGELGEACNIAKKLARKIAERGDLNVTADDLVEEIADFVCYADLWAARAGKDLGAAIVDKFDKVSQRMLSGVYLGPRKTYDVGSFVQYRHPQGSYGVITNLCEDGEYAYVRWYYGRDCKGDFMTGTAYVRIRDLQAVDRAAFWAVANKGGEGASHRQKEA